LNQLDAFRTDDFTVTETSGPVPEARRRWNIDGTGRHVVRIVDRYRKPKLVVIVAVGVMAVSGCARLTTHKPGAAASASAPDPTSAGMGADGQGVGGGAVPSSAPPVASGSSSPSGPPLDVLADGRSASYLKAINVSGRTLTFDLIQLLFGKDAAAVWVKTHPNEPDGPPEGYLLVNDNPKLRTMSLDPNVTVKVIDLNAPDPSAVHPIKLADLPGHLAGERNAPLPYWLTVANGRITGIQEEYLA
jgi:hypothetical protein